MEYILPVDAPGYPAGTRLTKREDGRYRTDDDILWFEAETVEGGFEQFIPYSSDSPQLKFLDSLPIYWYIDDQNNIRPADDTDTLIDRVRKATGNYFEDKGTAQVFLDKLNGS